MAKKSKPTEKSAKNEKVDLDNIRLLEGTAFKNKDNKKKDGRSAIWIKDEHLEYEIELKKLQIELMKLQMHMKVSGQRVLAIFEYNRAMVEPVMGFCTDEQNKRFLKDVSMLEEMLVKDGIRLFKFYFSVSKAVQKERFDSRKSDPLKQYKLSPVDNLAQEYWDQYSIRKFQMLTESNRTLSPWTIIRSDNKKRARINCMKHILSNMDYGKKLPEAELQPDPEIIISGIDEIRHMEEMLM